MDVIVHPSYDEIEDFVENASLDDFLASASQPRESPWKSFVTDKGSYYNLAKSEQFPGAFTTTRLKSLHQGHDPNDIGWKTPSVLTVFVDEDMANKIGYKNQLMAEKIRIGLYGDKIYHLNWNDKLNAFGKNAEGTYSLQPKNGLHPVELWDLRENTEDLTSPSFTMWAANHPGNKISGLTTAQKYPNPVTTVDVPAKEIIDPVKGSTKKTMLIPDDRLPPIGEDGIPIPTVAPAPSNIEEELLEKAVEDKLLAKAGNYLRNGAQGNFKFRDLMNKNVATLGGSAAGLALLNAIEGDSLLGNLVQTGTGAGLGALAGGLIRNTKYANNPISGLIVGGAALAGNTLMGAIGSMLGMDEKDEQILYQKSLEYANGAPQQRQIAYASQRPYV